MKRHAWILALSGLVACRGSDPASSPPPSGSGSAARGSAGTPSAPAATAAPVIEDLSGRWACTWDLADGSGDESWTLMQDGTSITVSLRGRDPGGSYSGSMTGTINGRSLELSYKFNDGTKGTMSLKASANGKVLDGESVRASAKARPQHYACARDDGGTASRPGGSRGGGGGRSDPTADCKKATGVAYLEDCQQACWAAGSLNEAKCREKCTAYCKPRP
jgi:hypothetical protein